MTPGVGMSRAFTNWVVAETRMDGVDFISDDF